MSNLDDVDIIQERHRVASWSQEVLKYSKQNIQILSNFTNVHTEKLNSKVIDFNGKPCQTFKKLLPICYKPFKEVEDKQQARETLFLVHTRQRYYKTQIAHGNFYYDQMWLALLN